MTHSARASGEVRDDLTSERVREERRPFEALGVEPARERVGELRNGEGVDGFLASPEPGKVGRVDAEPAREELGGGEHVAARDHEAVHEDDGPLPGALRHARVDSKAVDG